MSWSEQEYEVFESDGRVMLQLVKDKRIAQRLELVVTVLTLREAEALGCHNRLADDAPHAQTAGILVTGHIIGASLSEPHIIYGYYMRDMYYGTLARPSSAPRHFIFNTQGPHANVYIAKSAP